ncbi:MAG: dTDP-4-dehydrorhamnose reductase [Oscillospiraceae bacterium]|nr:dTDP-4-dehydrorhamnose reductase [Oscillospiraceae bacterium]
MRILITGAEGQLGRDVCREALRRGHEALGVDRADFDLADREAVCAALEAALPDAVVHCAAYTAVDRAENEPDLARAVNEGGTAALAGCCARRDLWLIYISTDYVFDGSGNRPWEPEDRPAPLSVYGKTKWLGELAATRNPRHMIVRTSWVFGAHGGNFVKTMLRLGAEQPELRVVEDQVGAPTYTADLARLLLDMAERPQTGIYHASNGGCCSWADFAAAILRAAELPARVIPIPSSDYPQAARRPKNSRLSPRALLAAGYEPLPAWEDALRRFLDENRAEKL